ncbi:GNAT family N-acetyltransferase [Pelotomaculum sp. FP]|uniref:GNAT family N-acetyltransferase n=1 Tax=Pelotomaculum sp. FP TaxID=261474 RepID=UPI001864A932|nr:GNAT family N-acetyltransferase [Pelotomaculum sp. FP]
MFDIAIIYEYKQKGGLDMHEYSFVKDAQKVGFRWQRVRCYNDKGNEVGFFDYDIQAPGWVTLQKLFVLKAFRGNGIADILIKHFLELSFNKLHANYISVYIHPRENGTSLNGLIRLHQKHGFEITDRKLSEAKASLKLQTRQ